MTENDEFERARKLYSCSELRKRILIVFGELDRCQMMEKRS
jgi:hypothetical protein